MPRAVVDVNVLVSALLGPEGPPAAVMRAWRAGAFELVVSARLLDELIRVTARPELARRLDSIAVDELLAALNVYAFVEDDPPAERVVKADPKDDYLVALARAAGAHAIVTGDGHLLDVEGLRPPALAPRAFLAWLDGLGQR